MAMQAKELSKVFVAGAVLSEGDYSDLIDLANVGQRALGLTEQRGIGPGLTYDQTGKVGVKDGNGVRVTDEHNLAVNTDDTLTFNENRLTVNCSAELRAKNGTLAVQVGPGLVVRDEQVQVSTTGQGIAVGSQGVSMKVRLQAGLKWRSKTDAVDDLVVQTEPGKGLTTDTSGLRVVKGDGVQTNSGKALSLATPREAFSVTRLATLLGSISVANAQGLLGSLFKQLNSERRRALSDELTPWQSRVAGIEQKTQDWTSSHHATSGYNALISEQNQANREKKQADDDYATYQKAYETRSNWITSARKLNAEFEKFYSSILESEKEYTAQGRNAVGYREFNFIFHEHWHEVSGAQMDDAIRKLNDLISKINDYDSNFIKLVKASGISFAT
jgi:hypothetical protein